MVAGRPAGLLLRSGAGSRYRSIAAAAARHAGRVNFGPTVRRSNILTDFLPERHYASAGTSHGPVSVSVCLSVSMSVSDTSRCSVKTVKRIGLVLA